MESTESTDASSKSTMMLDCSQELDVHMCNSNDVVGEPTVTNSSKELGEKCQPDGTTSETLPTNCPTESVNENDECVFDASMADQSKETGKAFNETPEKNCDSDDSDALIMDCSEESCTGSETECSGKEEESVLNKELLKGNDCEEIVMECSDNNQGPNLSPELLKLTPNKSAEPSDKTASSVDDVVSSSGIVKQNVSWNLANFYNSAFPPEKPTGTISEMTTKQHTNTSKNQDGSRVVAVNTKFALPGTLNKKEITAKCASESKASPMKINLISRNNDVSSNKPGSEEIANNIDVQTSKLRNTSDGNPKNVTTPNISPKIVPNGLRVIHASGHPKKPDFVKINLAQSTTIVPVKRIIRDEKGPIRIVLKDSQNLKNLNTIPVRKTVLSKGSSATANSPRITKGKGSKTATFVPILPKTTSSTLPMLYGPFQSLPVIIDNLSGTNTDTTSITINKKTTNTLRSNELPGSNTASRCVPSNISESNILKDALIASEIIPDDDSCVPPVCTAPSSDTPSNILSQAMEAANIIGDDQPMTDIETEQDHNPDSNCDIYRKNADNDLAHRSSASLDRSKLVDEQEVVSENADGEAEIYIDIDGDDENYIDLDDDSLKIVNGNIQNYVDLNNIVDLNVIDVDGSIGQEDNIPAVFVRGKQVVGDNVSNESNLKSAESIVGKQHAGNNVDKFLLQEEETIPADKTNQSQAIVYVYRLDDSCGSRSHKDKFLYPVLRLHDDLVLCKTVIPKIEDDVNISSMTKNKVISIPASQMSRPVSLKTVQIVHKDDLIHRFLMVKDKSDGKYYEYCRGRMQSSVDLSDLDEAKLANPHSLESLDGPSQSDNEESADLRYLIDVSTLKSTEFRVNQICPECGIYFMDMGSLRYGNFLL